MKTLGQAIDAILMAHAWSIEESNTDDAREDILNAIATRYGTLVAAAEAIFADGDEEGERPDPVVLYRRYVALRAALDALGEE